MATVSPGVTEAGVVDVMVSVNGIKTVEVLREQAADTPVVRLATLSSRGSVAFQYLPSATAATAMAAITAGCILMVRQCCPLA